MKLPPSIEEVVVESGMVQVLAAPEACDGKTRLSVNGFDTALNTVEDAVRGQAQFLAKFPLNDARLVGAAVETETGLQVSPGAVLEGRVNALPDWTLSNSETAHIRLFDRAKPLKATLSQSQLLPAHRRPLVFRAELGAHRARGEFRLTVAPTNDDPPRVECVSFDSAYLGGQVRSGYQEVTINLPPTRQDCRLSIEIAYLSYRTTDEDNDPYLFVADPKVTSQKWTSPVVLPKRIRSAAVSGARWFEAQIPEPILAGSGPVQLRVGSQRITLFEPTEADMKLVETHGHKLVLQASSPDRYTFFLDQEPAFAAHVGTEPTSVHIDTSFMTAGEHHLSVRDSTGTQTFLETYLLLPRILTPEDALQRATKGRFPGALSSRAAHRYDIIRNYLENPGSAEETAQMSRALKVLEGGYDNVKLAPLAFPQVDSPDVSVIIPAHNKVAVTYYGLCALFLARNAASFEVIVVDDASTDETARLEESVSGITVIRNAEPQRFIRACNAGVAASKGKYVVLLNNDTEPTPGWLDALIDAFGRFPDVGLAGSKLLYPDGTLQDAGGIIWNSGNPWNYGNRQNPWDPRFCYARQADYLSGAAMMTTRKIWDMVGGLSDYLEPMYFEDTDFAFKVREAGYSTWFVPSSIVYHFEGMTSGTDVTTGFKKHQEENRPKFKRQWARAFNGFGPEGRNPDLEKDRGIIGRVLFIDYTTPCPDQDAGGYAALQEMRLVRSLGYKVTFLPKNMAHLGPYTEDLERNGIEVATAPFYLSVEDFLTRRGTEFDAVYITRYYVAQSIIDRIRQVVPHAKILFNNADLHFLRELRTAIAQDDPEALEHARSVRDEELEVIRKTDLVLSYNDVEHAVIETHTDGAVKVVKCPWVVEVPARTPPPFKARSGLSFLGSFNHHPNAEGLTWFVREVMPLLKAPVGSKEAKAGPIELAVYGANMNDEIRALASDTVDPIGYIEDVADAYDRHRIFIAPLLSGAGIKGKVLGALAHGIPCILTPVAAEGVGLRNRHDCLIARTPREWVEAIRQIHGNPEFWAQLSENGRNYMHEHFSFAAGREMMRAAFETAELFGALD